MSDSIIESGAILPPETDTHQSIICQIKRFFVEKEVKIPHGLDAIDIR